MRIARPLSVALAAAAAVAAEPAAPPAGLALRVNGRPVRASASAAVEVPAGRLTLQSDALSRRVRYRLDGVDAEWREPEGTMRLVAVFFDASGDWLAETSFALHGESSGWSGSPDVSPLEARRDRVPVPARAAAFAVCLTSAGPPAAVGTLALASLRVAAVSSEDGRADRTLMELSPPSAGADDAPPAESAGLWVRSGTRPSMAQVLPASRAPSGRVLAVVDEDAKSHAEWQSPRLTLDGAPLPALMIDWSLCYSIGLAEGATALYPRLQPGRLVFRVRALTLAGQPVGSEFEQPLVVLAPVWQRPWFLVLCGMAAAALALGALRYRSWRRTRRELARLRQLSLVEAERARIARDIHDDLGATLTHISMLSQPAVPESASVAELNENLMRINRAAREMTQAMDEIVWAVNPQNDRLDRLVIYLDSYAQEFLSSAGIDFRSDYPERVPARPVPAPVRHSLFLAFKEALANAARHAACRTVRVALAVSDGALTLTLEDDGCGFGAGGAGRPGNGLVNMRRRLEALGGRCVLESAPGRGTRVAFELPLEE